jgi:hypothetical protein
MYVIEVANIQFNECSQNKVKKIRKNWTSF